MSETMWPRPVECVAIRSAVAAAAAATCVKTNENVASELNNMYIL